MKVITQERNTDEWRAAHRRHITASDIPDAMSARETLRYRKLVERLVLDFESVGNHTDDHPDPWQTDHEYALTSAVATYRRNHSTEVMTTGLCEHDNLHWLGASPHGLIGSNGALHIRPRRNLRTFMQKRIGLHERERAKLQTIMFVCDRAWIDVTDYWDGEGRVPDRLHSKRVYFQYSWFADVVLSRVTHLWDDVRGTLDKRNMVG